MHALLRLSGLIDAITERVGRAARWLILLTVLISAGNAAARYTFNISSNAWLEVQWYLFAAVFLLCAGYALKHNQHVRVDVVASRLSRRDLRIAPTSSRSSGPPSAFSAGSGINPRRNAMRLTVSEAA